MSVRWTVLASGSAGNSALIDAHGAVLLIDFGLGPRTLARRLAALDRKWSDVQAVLLTHTHGDHWNCKTLAHLAELNIPLYCHPSHRRDLQAGCPEFVSLQFARRAFWYEAGRTFSPLTGVRCCPFGVPHDGGPTFGFRCEGPAGLFSSAWTLAYAADLGSWTPAVIAALSDVDVLALEFNHDVALQRGSGRAAWLIERVLDDHGHLSNEQAATLVELALRRSPRGRVKHLVQLHLSRDCNRPELAVAAAERGLSAAGASPQVHTAGQCAALPCLELDFTPQMTVAARE